MGTELVWGVIEGSPIEVWDQPETISNSETAMVVDEKWYSTVRGQLRESLRQDFLDMKEL